MPDETPEHPQRNGVDLTLIRNGGLSYMEIPAVDVLRSAAFYESVLVWTINRDDPATPKFTTRDRDLIGRWTTARPAAGEPGLLPYFYVDDIHDAVSRVTPNGGEIVKAIFPEWNLLIATVRDPGGNVIGLWQVAP